MTLPASTAQQLESLRRQLARQRPEWGDTRTQTPVERYFSPAIWQAKVECLFRPLP